MYIYIHYVSGFKIFKTHPSGKSQARLPSTACRGRVYGSAPRVPEPMSSGGSLVDKSPIRIAMKLIQTCWDDWGYDWGYNQQDLKTIVGKCCLKNQQ